MILQNFGGTSSFKACQKQKEKRKKKKDKNNRKGAKWTGQNLDAN